MERTVSFLDLAQEAVLCDFLECHRQLWKGKREWLGYVTTPRFADGLMLVCSELDVRIICEDGEELLAGFGDVIYAPKGVRYTTYFYGSGERPNLYTVNFRLIDRDGRALRMGDRVCVFRGAATPECRKMVSELTDLYLRSRGDHFKQQSRFFALLDVLLDRIAEEREPYSWLRPALDALSEEWNQNKKMEYYASLCGMSDSGFYHAFRRSVGVSPLDYRTAMRMSAAKSALRNSNLTVAEIAAEVGFEDAYYFSRIFKKNVGVSPRAYRNHGDGAQGETKKF